MMDEHTVVRRANQGLANQAFGLPRSFLVRAEDTQGALSQWIEDVPAGAGPPMHVHHREIELFRVLAGEFRFWAAAQSFDAQGGDTVLIPAGTAHAFKNTGAGSGQLLVTMTPGGLEGFFIEVQARQLHPSTDMPQIAAIAARFNLEFVGPPPA